MPGVPHSLACDTCRKKKRKCDQQKPICGRCERLKLPCEGSGVRRWHFKADDKPELVARKRIPAPRTGPSNEQTKVTSNLVYILGIEDLRYNIRIYGGQLFVDLPRRSGSSRALDASIGALVAAYNSIQFNQPQTAALVRYGDALKELQMSLQNPHEPIVVKMFAIYNIYVCQEWINRKSKSSQRHREMLAFMLQDVVSLGVLQDIDLSYMYGLCEFILWETLLNPRIQLGPWFWDAINISTPARPPRYQRGTFLSLELPTRADMALYLRDPVRHRYQLQCIYDLVVLEQPFLREAAGDLKICASCPHGYGLLLAVGSVLNRVLRALSDADLFADEMHEFCRDAVLLASEHAHNRPFGAAFVPEVLKVVWAANTDGHLQEELQACIVDYESDFEDAEYLNEARAMRKQFERFEEQLDLASPKGSESTDDSEMRPPASCVVQ